MLLWVAGSFKKTIATFCLSLLWKPSSKIFSNNNKSTPITTTTTTKNLCTIEKSQVGYFQSYFTKFHTKLWPS